MVNVYKLFTNWGGYFSGCGGDAGFLCGGVVGFPFSLGIGLGDVGVAFLHLPAILGGFSLCT